jgi:LacI family transcriptional regulator
VPAIDRRLTIFVLNKYLLCVSQTSAGTGVEANVLLQIVMTDAERNDENALLRKWMDEQIAGVIYGSLLTRNVDPPAGLTRHRAVNLNCYGSDARFASIVPVKRRGGEVATQALIDEGHRRIAFISGEPWMKASDQRLEGYERTL